MSRLLVYLLISLWGLLGWANNCPTELKLGWEEALPYQFIKNGKLQGIDIEIFDSVMESLGCSSTKIKLPWKRLLVDIENGRMDVAAGASPTPDRAVYGLFSSSYNEEPVNFYIRKSDRENFKPSSLADLTDGAYKFGVLRGAYNGPDYDDLVAKGKFVIGKNILEFSSEKQLIMNLVKRGIDGFFLGGDPINYNKNIMRYPRAFFVSETTFMFSKKSVPPEFVLEFTKALNQLKNSGKVKAILKKHLSKDDEKYEM